MEAAAYAAGAPRRLGTKRRPQGWEWEPPPKQGVSEAAAAARLRALGAQHDHGYSRNGLGSRPHIP